MVGVGVGCLYTLLLTTLVCDYSSSAANVKASLVPNKSGVPTGASDCRFAAGSLLTSSICTHADATCLKQCASRRFKRFATSFVTRFAYVSGFGFRRRLAGIVKMGVDLRCKSFFNSSLGTVHLRISALSGIVPRGRLDAFCADISPGSCCGRGKGPVTMGTCSTMNPSADGSRAAAADDNIGREAVVRAVGLPGSLNSRVFGGCGRGGRCFGAPRDFVGGMLGKICVHYARNSKAVLCVSNLDLGLGFRTLVRDSSNGQSSLICGSCFFKTAGRIVRTGRFDGNGELRRLTRSPSRACLGDPTNVFARTAFPVTRVCGRRGESALGNMGMSFAHCGRGRSGCGVNVPRCMLVIEGGSVFSFFRRGGVVSGGASFLDSCDDDGGACAFAGVTPLVACYVRRQGGNVATTNKSPRGRRSKGR